MNLGKEQKVRNKKAPFMKVLLSGAKNVAIITCFLSIFSIPWNAGRIL